jgi:hypothetical protein
MEKGNRLVICSEEGEIKYCRAVWIEDHEALKWAIKCKRVKKQILWSKHNFYIKCKCIFEVTISWEYVFTIINKIPIKRE